VSLNFAIMHVRLRIPNAFSRECAEYNEVLFSVGAGWRGGSGLTKTGSDVDVRRQLGAAVEQKQRTSWFFHKVST
jgi:hypothetical protein